MTRSQALYAVGAVGHALVYSVMSSLLVARYAAPETTTAGGSGPSIAALGMLVTGYKLVEALLEPQIGLAVDIGGPTRRRSLMLSSTVGSTGSLLVLFHPAWFPPYPSQVICIASLLLVFAVSFATFFVCHSALVMDVATPGPERIRVSHAVATCAFIGMCLGLVLAPTVVDRFGYGPMATSCAAIAAACMVTSSMGLPPRRAVERAGARASTSGAVGSFLKVLRNSHFTLLTTSRACAGLCTNITALTIPLMLKSKGRPLREASLSFGCILLACGAGLLIAPAMLRRVRAGNVFFFSLAVITAGTIGLALTALSDRARLEWAALVTIGIGLAGYFTVPQALLADVIEESRMQRSTYEVATFGLHGLLVNVGKSCAGLVAGGVLSWSEGYARTDGPALLLAAAGATCGLGAVVFLASQRPRSEAIPS